MFELIKQCIILFDVLKPECVKKLTSVENLNGFDFTCDDSKYSKDKISLGFIADKIMKQNASMTKITDGDVL